MLRIYDTYSNKEKSGIKEHCFIILLGLIMASCIIDTKMFVYPALSKTLISSLLILLFSALTLYVLIRKRSRLEMNILTQFIVAWVTYICLHGLLLGSECYKASYLAISLIFACSIGQALRCGLIRKSHIKTSIKIMAGIESVYVILQFVGCIDTQNVYYAVTGINGNPNVSAIFLTCSFPLFIEKAKEKQKLHTILSLVTIATAIILLKCRTAYLGLIISLTISTYRSIVTLLNGLSKKAKVLVYVIVITFGAGLALQMYVMKKNSADGRILIWKTSMQMILNRPEGTGYGLFEKEYNLSQANYFKTHKSKRIELKNASYVSSAYNDYIENGVQGGIIGMAFIIVFYILGIHLSLAAKDITSLAIVCSTALMSMTNFVQTSISPWLTVVAIYGILSTYGNKSSISQEKSLIICCICLVLLLYPITTEAKKTKSQMILATYNEKICKDEEIEKNCIKSLCKRISTSECYWRICAKNHIMGKRYEEAEKAYMNAYKYSTTPSLHYNLYNVLRLLGREDEGIKYIEINYWMLPAFIEPKVILMDYYDRKGLFDKAIKYANEAVMLNPKIRNNQYEKFKDKAINYINLRK